MVESNNVKCPDCGGELFKFSMTQHYTLDTKAEILEDDGIEYQFCCIRCGTFIEDVTEKTKLRKLTIELG